MDPGTDRALGRSALALRLLLIVVLLATLGRAGGRRALESLGLAAPSTTAYAPGDTLDLPANVYRLSPFTLVIFARPDCAACQAAQSFYHALALTLQRSANTRLVVWNPTPDPAGAHAVEDAAYALQIDSHATLASRASQIKPRVTLVPTLVLVNAGGVVLGAWQGAPGSSEARRIQNFISTTIGAPAR